jgi:DNA adenine methylase
LPYLGGKQALVPRLLPLIAEHTAYVEVFGGAAALLLNKPASRIEVYNDLDGELVNLFEVIRDDVDAFLKRADFLLYSRELYQRWQTDLENGSVPGDRVERAVRFWYVIRSAFGAHPSKGWAFQRARPRNSAMVVQNALGNIRAIHDRLKSVEVDHLDFRRCIKNRDAPSTFLYVDPPYPETEQYRAGDFTLEDHRDLARILRDANSKWLMTVGDHPEIRKLYVDFDQSRITSAMAVEKVIGGKRGRLKHLLIRNYEPPKTPLYTAAATQVPLMDLFGLETPYR